MINIPTGVLSCMAGPRDLPGLSYASVTMHTHIKCSVCSLTHPDKIYRHVWTSEKVHGREVRDGFASPNSVTRPYISVCVNCWHNCEDYEIYSAILGDLAECLDVISEAIRDPGKSIDYKFRRGVMSCLRDQRWNGLVRGAALGAPQVSRRARAVVSGAKHPSSEVPL